MSKPTLAAIVARMQVPELTEGHKAIINRALKQYDTAIVLLGISGAQQPTVNNPYSFAQRVSVIRRHAPHIHIYPLLDHPSNEQWTRNLDRFLSLTFPGYEVSLLCGHNSGAENAYKAHGGRFTVDAFAENSGQRGTAVRESIRENNSVDFLRGMAYALNQQFHNPYPTVDIALIEGESVWMGRKAEDPHNLWRFPGGFVEPGMSLEATVRKEAWEELGVSNLTDPVYLGSTMIDDYRYKDSPESILTSIFACSQMSGPRPKAGDDLDEALAIPLENIFADPKRFVISNHIPLVHIIKQKTGAAL